MTTGADRPAHGYDSQTRFTPDDTLEFEDDLLVKVRNDFTFLRGELFQAFLFILRDRAYPFLFLLEFLFLEFDHLLVP
jgi:hypothetical protein